jgi:hypothetical protein
MTRWTLVSLLLICSALGASGASHRAFTTIDVAGAIETDANGINISHVIVGSYVDIGGVSHGWIRKGDGIETFDVPGSTGTFAHGINGSNQIVGWYTDSSSVQHGFLLVDGTFTTIDFPGATLTNAWGIDDSGAVVGTYQDSSGTFHGFTEASGVFTTLDIPGAVHTETHGISTNGFMVGLYVDASGIQHGFLTKGKKNRKGQILFFSATPDPVTTIDGVRDGSSGATIGVVVSYAPSQSGPFQCSAGGGGGNGGVNFPGAVDTRCHGISGLVNRGASVVGSYTDTNGVIHGFFTE